jgi:hypothetical protein
MVLHGINPPCPRCSADGGTAGWRRAANCNARAAFAHPAWPCAFPENRENNREFFDFPVIYKTGIFALKTGNNTDDHDHDTENKHPKMII